MVPKYRVKPIGYYRDSKVRIRPITARKPKIPIIPAKQREGGERWSIKATEYFFRVAFKLLIEQTPIARELYLTYVLADSIYNSWNLIKELYEKKELVVDSEAIHNVASSIQTNIIWRGIKNYIPEEHREESFDILSNVVDKVTSEEIKYVKKFLQSN